MEFSIIVPVYNVSSYLRQCLDSITKQEGAEYEVIVVDDGSTDDSGNICDEYADTYENVRVIHQKNQGSSSARNTGLDAANGEWILFVDSDDWIEDGMLQKIAVYIRKTPAEIYSFNAQKVNEQGSFIEKIIYSPENDCFNLTGEKRKFDYYFDGFMQYKFGWEVWSRVFRLDIIRDAKLRFQPMDQVFAEDYLFVFQYLLRVKKAEILCNIFYNYRQREDSLTHKKENDTILPRLYHWLEVAYKDVQCQNLRYFKRNYHRLFFMLINFHIQYPLQDMSNDSLGKTLSALEKSRKFRKWIQQARKERETLEKYMVVKSWL